MREDTLGVYTQRYSAPIAIGGLGGSGTRLVAEMLKRVGCYIGSDLNRASDNLWFTLLFKRPEILKNDKLARESLVLFFKVMNNTPLTDDEQVYINKLGASPCAEFDATWSKARVLNIYEEGKQLISHGGFWGWKEPNTHLYIDKLLKSVPNMKYIHVMRHGLDMAFSTNKRQLLLWGEHLLGDNSNAVDPARALRYWLEVHDRIKHLQALHPRQVLLLNYDNLCAQPDALVSEVESFLGLNLTQNCKQDLLGMPKMTKVGRYKKFSLSGFEPQDIARVRAFGFVVD